MRGVCESFQKTPLFPEMRSGAMDFVMSITTSNKGQSPNKGHRANKGQPQMDNVHKSLGFRTSRDPFQENSSQGIEGNKGKKFTPSRRVVCSGTSTETTSPRVCPLERDDSYAPRGITTVRAVRRFLGRKTPKPTATQWIYPRRSGDSGVTKATKCRPLTTRFFGVLTAPDFQEKKR